MTAGRGEREIAELVARDGLLGDGPVVALLSGGADSTCLLDVVVRVAGRERVRALHVNYGLRPEADGDEGHCAALCERLAVELIVERAGEPDPGNLQAWARALRYDAAARIAAPLGALVAAGHTADDQVETILYRLAASPGRRALLGMAPREGRLVRPLLAITRAETMSYCRERGLGWREDASNADSRFARARVRHRLLPALRELHPAAEANVLRTAALLRDEAAVLDALVAGETAGGTVAIERWDQLDQALRRLVVQRLADDCAGAPVPGAAGRAAEIGELAARGQGALDIGAGVRAVVRGGELRMVPSEGRAQRRRETPRGALS